MIFKSQFSLTLPPGGVLTWGVKRLALRGLERQFFGVFGAVRRETYISHPTPDAPGLPSPDGSGLGWGRDPYFGGARPSTAQAAAGTSETGPVGGTAWNSRV